MERQKARALMESWNREYSFTENLEEELATSQTSQGQTELKRRGADKKVSGTYARAYTPGVCVANRTWEGEPRQECPWL